MAEISSSNERNIYAKLEAIKDIRNKTIQLEKLKLRIIKEVKIGEEEDKCLAEYRKEMELLLQEKMSHVEELRQIHADINEMEAVIKQAEENRIRSVGIANRMHDEYLPLKLEVDHMRREYLGLSPLRDLHEEEGTNISKERFQNNYFNTKTQITSPQSFARPHARHPLLPPEATVTSLASTPHAFMPPPPPVGAMRMNKTDIVTGVSGASGVGGGGGGSSGGGSGGGPPNRLQQSPSIGMGHPTFRSDFNVNLRQQPPPMKSCLSCHQQIHRNAPICPLCKAKSRSRNPKKPKKKDH